MNVVRHENLSEIIQQVIKKASDSASDFSVPTWLVVPDRFTLKAEELLLKHNSVLLNTRVLSFSMLYNIVSSELNASNDVKILDKTSAVLFMWKAIQSVKSNLVWFAKSASSYSFAEKMFNTVNQLASNMVDFDKLHQSSKSPITIKKMQDIQAIYRAYKALTSDYTDASGMLGYLIKNIERSKLVKQSRVFVVGFEHLTVQRKTVVNLLSRFAKQFEMGIRAGSELDVKPQLAILGNWKDEIIGQNSVTDEAYFVANEIRRLVQQGSRYRDIVVCVCGKNLIPVYQTVLAECDISVNCDVNQILSEHPAAILLKNLILLGQNPNTKNILGVAHSLYCTVGRKELFELENMLIAENAGIRAVTKDHGNLLDYIELSKQINKKPVKTLKSVVSSLEQEGVAHRKLSDVLETIESIMGSTPFEIPEFLHMFQGIVGAITVSSIPTYVDRVLLVNTKDYQPSRVPHLFITGVSEDNFPIPQDDTDIITQFDIDSMSIVIDPSPRIQNMRNVNFANNVMASYTKTLIITGNNGAEQDTMQELYCSSVATRQLQRAISSNDVWGNQKLYGSLLRLLPMKDSRKSEAKLEKSSRQNFTVTELEAFYACPFSHFLKYGLKLEKRKIYGIHSNMIGLIIHDFLEDGRWQTEDSTNLSEILALKKYGLFTGNPANKPIIENLKKHCKWIASELRSIIAKGEFKPKFIEKSFKDSLGDVTIHGKADRIDVAGKCAIVLDYKAGVSSFSYKDIYMGTKLQLPLYLGFLEKDFQPLGAFYVPLKPSLMKQRSLQYTGMVTPEGAELLGEGIVSPRQIITREQLSSVVDYSRNLAQSAIQHIQKGVILKSPASDSACRYCLYCDVCDGKTNVRREQVQSVKVENFEGLING